MLYALWGQHEVPIPLSGEGESVSFRGHAFIRVSESKVEASGDVRAMKVKVSGTPKLILNGREQPSTVRDGIMSFGE